MNEADRKKVFDQIFKILDPNVSKWSVINVEQFLQIINCGQFEKFIRCWGVNGQMLLEPSKIQAILIPQLKPSTILLYEKLMFMLEQLKPTQYRKSDFTMQRHSRDTLSVPGNLMKAFKMGIDAVAEKNMVLWTTKDLVTFLLAVGFTKFRNIVELSSSDGLIMLYVVSDRRKMNRMSKSFEAKQLQQIVYISQIMLAQYYMPKNQLDDDLEEVEFFPQIHPDIIFNLKRVQSIESITEPPEEIMLAQSMQSVYEQNDFIISQQADSASILQPIENIQKNSPTKTNTKPLGEENGQNKMGVSKHSLLAVSQYPQESNSHHDQSIYPDKTELSMDKNEELDMSQYPQSLDKSEFPEQRGSLATSQYQNVLSSSVRLAESSYQNVNENKKGDDSLSLSSYPIDSQFDQSNSIFSFEPGMAIGEQDVEQFNQLKKETLTMPFDIMNFEKLNWITLKQLVYYQHDPHNNSQNYIDQKQTFGVKGCKFGRDSGNDYSYPDEMSISSKHAIIFFKDNRFFLQDLGSKGGTFKQINKIQIYDGLLIQLAFEIEITFQIILRENHQGAVKVIFKRPTSMPNYQAILPNGMSCRIGRSTSSKILIDSNFVSVSQKHAEIEYHDKKFYFKDSNSQNGSWMRLSPKGIKSELYPLDIKDVIRISSKKKFQVSNIQIQDLDLEI